MLRPYRIPRAPSRLLLALLRRRKADHLHARAVRNIHRLHHLTVLPIGCRLDEQQLRGARVRSEEHTSELQSQSNLVCRLLLEKKKITALTTRLDALLTEAK